jgi:PIN domain nuclease of toxin-antitoxin system
MTVYILSCWEVKFQSRDGKLKMPQNSLNSYTNTGPETVIRTTRIIVHTIRKEIEGEQVPLLTAIYGEAMVLSVQERRTWIITQQ